MRRGPGRRPLYARARWWTPWTGLGLLLALAFPLACQTVLSQQTVVLNPAVAGAADTPVEPPPSGAAEAPYDLGKPPTVVSTPAAPPPEAYAHPGPPGKLLLNMLVKNEEDHLRRTLPLWAKVVDYWLIGLDDHNSDASEQVIREHLGHLPGEILVVTFDGMGPCWSRLIAYGAAKYPQASHGILADADFAPLRMEDFDRAGLDIRVSKHMFPILQPALGTTRRLDWIYRNIPGAVIRRRTHQVLQVPRLPNQPVYQTLLPGLQLSEQLGGYQDRTGRKQETYVRWLRADLASRPGDPRSLYYLGVAFYELWQEAAGHEQQLLRWQAQQADQAREQQKQESQPHQNHDKVVREDESQNTHHSQPQQQQQQHQQPPPAFRRLPDELFDFSREFSQLRTTKASSTSTPVPITSDESLDADSEAQNADGELVEDPLAAYATSELKRTAVWSRYSGSAHNSSGPNDGSSPSKVAAATSSSSEQKTVATANSGVSMPVHSPAGLTNSDGVASQSQIAFADEPEAPPSELPFAEYRLRLLATALRLWTARVSLPTARAGGAEEYWQTLLKLGELEERFLGRWHRAEAFYWWAYLADPARAEPVFYLGQHLRLRQGSPERGLAYSGLAAALGGPPAERSAFLWQRLHTCLAGMELAKALVSVRRRMVAAGEPLSLPVVPSQALGAVPRLENACDDAGRPNVGASGCDRGEAWVQGDGCDRDRDVSGDPESSHGDSGDGAVSDAYSGDDSDDDSDDTEPVVTNSRFTSTPREFVNALVRRAIQDEFVPRWRLLRTLIAETLSRDNHEHTDDSSNSSNNHSNDARDTHNYVDADTQKPLLYGPAHLPTTASPGLKIQPKQPQQYFFHATNTTDVSAAHTAESAMRSTNAHQQPYPLLLGRIRRLLDQAEVMGKDEIATPMVNEKSRKHASRISSASLSSSRSVPASSSSPLSRTPPSPSCTGTAKTQSCANPVGRRAFAAVDRLLASTDWSDLLTDPRRWECDPPAASSSSGSPSSQQPTPNGSHKGRPLPTLGELVRELRIA